MNERIKLLKHQAYRWCDENIPEQYSEETNGYGSMWEDKFAELLIKECYSIIDVTSNVQVFTDKAYDKGYFDGRKDAASMLIDFFEFDTGNV